MYKYLHEVGITNQDEFEHNSLDIHVEIKLRSLSDFQVYPSFKDEEKRKTLDEVIANYGSFGWKTVALIPYLSITEEELPKLRDFIQNHITDFIATPKPRYNHYSTHMRKLICYYDWRMYGWEDITNGL